MNFYNENDPKAAAWLRELIAAGLIPNGDVDERSITEVRPHDIAHYTQQHFFAGIGGWPLALRLAGWPDSKPVRTGSCPCQPFSVAGNGLCEADERHLWPNFRDLITFGEPTITFGEQVASKNGRDWLAGVRADLEGLGYEVGAADLCAAGIGAPHRRPRIYWMAHLNHAGSQGRRRAELRQRAAQRAIGSRRDPSIGRLVLPNGAGRHEGRQGSAPTGHGNPAEPAGGDGAGRMAYAEGSEFDRPIGNRDAARRGRPSDDSSTCGDASPWSAFNILPFRDGKFRRVEAGTFPLAHGVPGRVGLLRGYGNAIVPQLAATFIQACQEALNDL